MKKPIIKQLEKWHNENKHELIVDTIESLPESEWDFELKKLLARAYANCRRYDQAYELLSTCRKEGENDALWNWRMGLSLYETGNREESVPFLERAIELGDDDPETARYLKLAQRDPSIMSNRTDAEARRRAKYSAFPSNQEDDSDDEDGAKDYQEADKFIRNVKIKDIPWHRLATCYGRAADFPKYFDTLSGTTISHIDDARSQIESNIEHQSTLWPATPFAMIFLARTFLTSITDIKKEANHNRVVNILDLFIEIAEGCKMGREIEHAEPLTAFEAMLEEKYLWSEEYDEDEDEAQYEEEGGPFPDDLFYSFYYYSNAVLKFCKDELQNYICSDKEVSGKIKHLFSLIN